MINLSVIKNISYLKKCAAGTSITGNGSGHIMFVVLKGEIGVYTDYKQLDSQMAFKLGAGDLFADPELMQDKRAAYTTVALTEAIILPIDKKGALDFIQDEPSMAFEMIKELCARVEKAESAYKTLVVSQSETQRHRAKGAPAKTAAAEAAGAPSAAQDNQNAPATAAEAPPQTAPAAPEPKKPEPVPVQKGGFQLFPEGHGQYKLILNGPDSPYLMKKNHTCPICRSSFSAQAVRPSKLVVASTDPDLRYHYKEVEPLYYEIITCPHCLYSALPDVFDAPDKLKSEIQKALTALKGSVHIDFSAEKTADTVFAGFYTALHCAPVSFTNHEIVTGRLLYKLSRVYHDAGDENLENLTALKALEHFTNAYTSTNMSPSQEQQVCVTIGELYYKQNDLRNAITYFSKAKSNNSSAVLKNHADSRIYDIRSKAGEQRS